ncbi:MAG: acyl-CoA/acyl-ACP dehydrogenase [Deltaproteobacteria bacterium]|nr:acyl-CoA/acyl-ACP dehydrogenase [Deltaproteobacteria bacterium]
MTLEAAELNAFVETARRFSKRDVPPLLQGEERDGDLGTIPGILQKAEAAGLMASSDPGSPGHEFGVWGRACLVHGPAFSLALLKEVAASCAGVAACLHFAGLGALEAPPSETSPVTAVALFEEGWRLTWQALSNPPKEAAQLRRTHGAVALTGAKSFVHAAPGCRSFAVFAAGESGWHKVLVPRDTQGLTVSGTGLRTGLAALAPVHLIFDHVPVEPSQILPSSDLRACVTRLFLGLAAISVGNAAGALESVRSYAGQRYQGGYMIETHPAVLGLMGDVMTRVWACDAHLKMAAEKEGGPDEALRQAAGAKLRITAECCQAVTDSMQVMGGYGYMEDFGVEKRLRDALTLKTMCGRPDDLRMLCARTGSGGMRDGI